jgi:hypothetical protein
MRAILIFAGIEQDEHVAEHVCSLEMVKEHYSASICTRIEDVGHFSHRKPGKGSVCNKLNCPSSESTRDLLLYLLSTPSVSFYLSLSSTKLHYPAINKKKQRK